MRARPQNGGFTLVEIAIVVVIIGLLIGGVLVGSAMMSAAQNSRYMNEISKIRTSWNVFYLKYQCYAGDCVNATTLFSDPLVANGDGDNLIGWPGEAAQTWWQLHQAGIYGNRRVGMVPVTDVTAPSGTGILYIYMGNLYGPPTPPTANYINTGGSVNATWVKGATHKPEESEAIDRKMDDGMPGSGKVWTGNGQDYVAPFPDYTTCLAVSGTDYNLAETRPVCRMLFGL